MPQPQRSLYSIGFNAFNQTSPHNNEDPIPQYTQKNVNNIIFATWESTIITKDDNQLEMWGWIPETCIENNYFLKAWENQRIKRIFGPIDLGWIGVIDYNNILWYYDFNSKNKKKLAIDIKDADYCQSREEIYVLTNQGFVDCYQQEKEQDDLLFTFKKRFPTLPKVYSMAVSFSHVLFYIQEGTDPIFGLNSNRYSQLGFDTTTIQNVNEEPIPIDFFSGLMVQKEASVACNSFHSAVVIDGELYTFGWKKSGRLGRSSSSFSSIEDEDEDIIGLAEFRDHENQVIEDIYVIKVVCGINHTMVLDDQGQVWTCGSNIIHIKDQYKQLGRTTGRENEESPYDDVFRLCTAYTGFAVDCFAGRWNSFVITQTPQS